MAKKAQTGHEEEPEFMASSGSRSGFPPPSQPALSTNERDRPVHCFASKEFRPYIEIMLKGTQLRVDMDDMIGRSQPYRELDLISNQWSVDFNNYFEDQLDGDEDLRGIDPNACPVKQTDAFLKGNCYSYCCRC